MSSTFDQAKMDYHEHMNRLHCLMSQVADLERMVEKKKKAMYEACTHEYEVQPREYQSPREWICLKCSHRI